MSLHQLHELQALHAEAHNVLFTTHSITFYKFGKCLPVPCNACNVRNACNVHFWRYFLNV